MSTRANIKISDDWDSLWFYRHSDGYPSGVRKTLRKFIGWVVEGRIRADAGQASGWLIIIGNQEYDAGQEPKEEDGIFGWKVGAYEPTSGKHGDIAYLYDINLSEKTIKINDDTYSFEQYLDHEIEVD